MVAVNSTMLDLGSTAPEFALPDVCQGGDLVHSEQFHSKPLLVMFICNHCPYVLRLMPELAQLGNEAMEKGVAVVAISANDIESYPQDGPQAMAAFAGTNGFQFPYLYDESQSTAKAFKAACTPDFFLFDRDHHLVYRGQMDDARPGNDVPADGNDLRAAINAMLAGEEPLAYQMPSIGCNIKWKPGNQPDYS